MWDVMNFYSGSFFFLTMLFPIIFIVLITIIIVKLILPKGKIAKKDSKALEILKERFAKGEISEEEYKNKKELLKD